MQIATSAVNIMSRQSDEEVIDLLLSREEIQVSDPLYGMTWRRQDEQVMRLLMVTNWRLGLMSIWPST